MLVDGVCAAEYVPGRTLQEDLATVQVKTVEGYAGRHPRLLFGAEDIQALKDKAKASPALWQKVLDHARGLGDAAPPEEEARTGAHYWRIPRVLSGALAHVVTGDKGYSDAAVRWMTAYCKVDTWGTDYRPNVDLQASWHLYYIALAYDILYPELTEEERGVIRSGLASHARAIYLSLQPPQEFRYEQNHTFIPASALAAAAFALLGEEQEAEQWVRLSYAMLRRSRYTLGEDGYYYEGMGYWAYALHWHVRYADILSRATGEPAHELPVLRQNYLSALHLTLPGPPFEFDIGDMGRGALSRPRDYGLNYRALLYRLASVFKDGACMATADRLAALGSSGDDPAMNFLWYDSAVRPANVEDLPTYHYFPDHDIVTWRSSWGPDATCCMFKCGPPEGHLAAGKLSKLDDWTMNSGHVHPDIGMFWLYARRHYLAVDTGYTAAKKTSDHNTLLVDGVGQGVDSSYWVYRGWPYSTFDAVRMRKVHLEKGYGYAMGDMSAAYPQDKLGKLAIRRHVLMTERCLIVLDDISAEKEHTYSWLLHSDQDLKQTGGPIVTEAGDARLLTYVLSPREARVSMGPAIVNAGNAPGPGEPQQRGYQLTVENAAKDSSTRFLVVLIPAAEQEKDPLRVAGTRLDDGAAQVEITWPDAGTERITVDLGWAMGQGAGGRGPAVIEQTR
jgi:hypothetical protein